MVHGAGWMSLGRENTKGEDKGRPKKKKDQRPRKLGT